MFLSHFSLKPLSLASLSPFSFSSSSLRFRSSSNPLFRFYPFHSLKSRPCPPPPSSPSIACYVSTSGGVPMDSPSPDLAVSVDSVARDLKNQSLNSDDDNHEEGPTLLKNKKKKKSLEDLYWDHSFVTQLPADPRTDSIPREVNAHPLLFCFYFFYLYYAFEAGCVR